MRGLWRWVVVMWGSAWLVGAAAAACPSPLRVGFQDAPFAPMLMGSGAALADPPGWSVLAIQEVAKRLGCPVQLVRLPGRRLLAHVHEGLMEFSLFFGPTPERLASVRYPLDAAGRPDTTLAPLFGHLALYALAGSPAARSGDVWDGRAVAPGTRVGVVTQSAQELVAQQRGWRLELPGNFDLAVQMLRARRFELFFTPREIMRGELLSGEGALVELSPIVQRLPYFVVASPSLWERDPEFVRRFWRETCTAVRQLAPEARPNPCGQVVPP